MNIVVAIVILVIIGLQISFFVKNLKRMHEFRDIFLSNQDDYHLIKDTDGIVCGIDREGLKDSSIFTNIRNSINKYLCNNKGSVIDFHLLKDAVDRHCDAVEEDINTQIPIPLYCGLAGTMLGVILGLSSLLWTGAINALIAGTGSLTTDKTAQIAANSAAGGVNHLLIGVALAMVASIVGIGLTTANSLLFKRCKLVEENGKNTFLAWMQSNLLPELPSDTAGVMKGLVRNLNKFNKTFSNNVEVLSGTFNKVNESYKTQAEMIQMVHDMDVTKMAMANINVLKELQGCTDKLEQFNTYLDKIDKFNLQFSEQAETQQIFRNISQFFNQHRAAISQQVADSNNALNEAIQALSDSSQKSVTELKTRLLDQSENFKTILEEEKEAFERFGKDIQLKFNEQMKQLPTIAKKMEEVSEIPGKLDQLLTKIEEYQNNVLERINASNSQLVQSIQTSNEHLIEQLATHTGGKESALGSPVFKFPLKIMVPLYLLVFVILLGFIGIFYFTIKSNMYW